jgi:hypothetical protein
VAFVAASPTLSNAAIADAFHAVHGYPSVRTLVDKWVPRAKRELRSTP